MIPLVSMFLPLPQIHTHSKLLTPAKPDTLTIPKEIQQRLLTVYSRGVKDMAASDPACGAPKKAGNLGQGPLPQTHLGTSILCVAGVHGEVSVAAVSVPSPQLGAQDL